MATPPLEQSSDQETAEAIIPQRRHRLPLAVVLALALVVPLLGGSLVVGGWAWHRFGSASAALAFLGGKGPVLIEPRPLDLGPVAPAEVRTRTLRVCNLSGSPIVLYGIHSFCSTDGCVNCESPFPVEVTPWSVRNLAVRVQVPRPLPDPLRLATTVYTDTGHYKVPITCEPR